MSFQRGSSAPSNTHSCSIPICNQHKEQHISCPEPTNTDESLQSMIVVLTTYLNQACWNSSAFAFFRRSSIIATVPGQQPVVRARQNASRAPPEVKLKKVGPPCSGLAQNNSTAVGCNRNLIWEMQIRSPKSHSRKSMHAVHPSAAATALKQSVPGLSIHTCPARE